MAEPGKILIVGNISESLRALHGRLYAMGFGVTDSPVLDTALVLCRMIQFDVVLIGEGAGTPDGVTACSAILREARGAVVMIVDAPDIAARRIAAFDAGADDYLTYPCTAEELAARIRARLRRGERSCQPHEEVITVGDITLEVSRRVALKAGNPIHLTPKEFGVLRYLMQHAGQPVSHASLLSAFWGPDRSEVTCLRTLIRQLRVKLDEPEKPRYLQTENHIGYRFANSAASQ